jgi:hypothetical protein
MARELKVFGTTLATFGDEWEKLGQARHVRQCRAIVAAATKKEAASKLGISIHEANGFMTETGNGRELAIALAKPGQVFAFPINYSGRDETYIEIERTPHEPVKRTKRLSYEERQALWDKADADRKARKFSAEELEHLVEMLTGANHPLSASIVEKARLLLSDFNESN